MFREELATFPEQKQPVESKLDATHEGPLSAMAGVTTYLAGFGLCAIVWIAVFIFLRRNPLVKPDEESHLRDASLTSKQGLRRRKRPAEDECNH